MRVLAVLAILAIAASAAAPVEYPKAMFSEDCTATWCGPCSNAYLGLEVMLDRYDANEFISIRYYATSGNYGNGDTTARLAYYAVSAFPTVLFNGTTRIVGADATTATGSVYDPVVSNGIAEPSNFKITINSFSVEDPGHIDFDVEVMETVADIGNIKIRAVLLENDLAQGPPRHTNATRDLMPDTDLTVSAEGQVQNVVHNFAVDPLWTNEKWLAVFIQDDDDKSILQAASNAPAPQYSPRFWTKGNRAVVVSGGAAAAEHQFDDFAVFNLGTDPDVIRVSLDASEMPVDWDCVFTDGVTDYTTFVDVPLNPGESTVFHVNVTPNSPGYAKPKILLTTNNIPGFERTILYNLVTNDVDVLLVDDDGPEAYEDYHTDAFDNYGASYGIWDRNLAATAGADLTQFEVIFWQCGFSFPTLDQADRDALATFLDGGGKLFITGQDIGWDQWDQGGSAITWYRTYLHTTYVSDDVNRNLVNGVAGDPVSDGLALNLLGGDGANNNFYPSYVQPFDEFATTIFNYDNGLDAGTKAQTPVHKVVYLAFPYESINNAADRRTLTAQALDWFAQAADAPEDVVALRPSVSAFPNPAAGGTTLSYVLPADGAAKLRIYALDGSLVRTLLDGEGTAGRHAIRWDGLDDSGHRMSSGVYFYRLEAGEMVPSGRLTLTK